MCRIYNVNLKLLPTVYHYTGQTDVRNNIVRRRHQFLSKCSLNSNSVITLLIDLIVRVLQCSIYRFYVVFLFFFYVHISASAFVLVVFVVLCLFLSVLPFLGE